MSRITSRSRRLLGGAIAVAAATAMLTGCTAGGGGSEAPTTLNVQFVGPPLFGMNPAKTGGGSSILFASAAYDALIFKEPDGSFSGDLATDWEFIGDQNEGIILTIREGVTFSDGAKLDAAAVKKSLEYTRDGGFYPSVQLAAFADIQATDDDTVEIHFSQPVPNALNILSQNGVGYIISPDALDTPDVLDTETVGAGPYVLDTAATVVGSSYVYTRNPDYWNPDAVKMDTLVVQAINDPNSTLSAIQTDQVQVSLGNTATAAAAKDAGITVHAVAGAVQVLTLFDRDGSLVPALADERVRQAINFALNREGITTAVAGDYGVPTDQLALPGSTAYDASLDDTYGYDPDRATQLLEEAGYADGFDLPITCSSFVGNCKLAEAIASDLNAVGIRATIDEVSGEVQGFDDKLRSGTVPAAVQGPGGEFERMIAIGALPSPSPISGNPFQSEDPQITELYQQAIRISDRDEQGAVWQKLNARLQELAWYAPVYVSQNLYYTRAEVQGFEVSDANPVYTPVDPVDGSSTWFLQG